MSNSGICNEHPWQNTVGRQCGTTVKDRQGEGVYETKMGCRFDNVENGERLIFRESDKWCVHET